MSKKANSNSSDLDSSERGFGKSNAQGPIIPASVRCSLAYHQDTDSWRLMVKGYGMWDPEGDREGYKATILWEPCDPGDEIQPLFKWTDGDRQVSAFMSSAWEHGVRPNNDSVPLIDLLVASAGTIQIAESVLKKLGEMEDLLFGVRSVGPDPLPSKALVRSKDTLNHMLLDMSERIALINSKLTVEGQSS